MIKILVLAVLLVPLCQAFKIVLTRYEGRCKGHPNPSAYFTDIKIYQKDGESYLEQSLKVVKQIPDLDKCVIIARRCPSKDDLDHCENFRNVTINNIGFLTMDSNSPWGQKLAYVPPITFPLKPGKYVARQSKMDQKWSMIVSKGYWRNFAIFFNKQGEEMFCIYAEGEIKD